MTIAETHRLFELIVKKTRNEYIKHEEIDDYLHMEQMRYFSTLLGNFKQYQAGRPVPPVTYGQTQRTLDELNPFKEKITFTTGAYNPVTLPYGVYDGILVLPTDYEYLESIQSVVYKNGVTRERPVSVIDGEEWAGRADSAIMPPTKMDAIARLEGRGGTVNSFDVGTRHKIRFLPKDISGHLFYFRTPAKPEYVFTLSGRTETHDAAASQDLEWGTVAAMNILIGALQLAGIRTEDALLVQTMAQNEAKSE
jgi:hypothetical protein